MSTPENVVQRQLDAYNARDIESFVQCFHDNATMRELGDSSLIAEGIDGIRESFTPLFEGSPELHAALVNRICSGSTVVDHERVTGMNEDGPFDAVAIYEVEDGRIRRVWFT